MHRHILRQQGDWTPQLELAIDDAWKRLLNSSIQGEVRLELKRRSDTDAIQVFRDNLYNLLLAPPAGPISVLGIDPGLRTGCKVAVVDETGKLLAHDVLYLHTSKHGNAEAAPKLEACCASTTCAPSPSAMERPRAKPMPSCATFCATRESTTSFPSR